MRLVLLGPPGAGKGTQAAAVRDRFGIPHISTGDMLRGAIAAGTPVGRKARVIVEGGNLVPDEIMAEMVKERLSAPDTAPGFLLDGYPRNIEQGVTLESILQALGQRLDHVLYLVLDDAEIVKRLSGRRTCGSCGAPFHVVTAPPATAGACNACGSRLVQREDDREEVVARRLKVYRERTEPLVGFYTDRGLLRKVDASGTVSDVRARLASALGGRPESPDGVDDGASGGPGGGVSDGWHREGGGARGKIGKAPRGGMNGMGGMGGRMGSRT